MRTIGRLASEVTHKQKMMPIVSAYSRFKYHSTVVVMVAVLGGGDSFLLCAPTMVAHLFVDGAECLRHVNQPRLLNQHRLFFQHFDEVDMVAAVICEIDRVEFLLLALVDKAEMDTPITLIRISRVHRNTVGVPLAHLFGFEMKHLLMLSTYVSQLYLNISDKDAARGLMEIFA